MAGIAVLVLRPDDGLIDPDPVDVSEFFSAEDIARARRFGRPQLALHAVAGLARVVVLTAFAAMTARRSPPTRLGSARARPQTPAGAAASVGAPAGRARLAV